MCGRMEEPEHPLSFRRCNVLETNVLVKMVDFLKPGHAFAPVTSVWQLSEFGRGRRLEWQLWSQSWV
jgi:hypothetical protein